MVDGEETLCTSMSALAILSCRPNSHPFQERHISLHETIKIGRSVARARPSANNGIFDCKVLSRHHAMLWYEAGKFYLQDTKSSNGTFINNQRLCKGGEESPAREVYSGDLIQFGVEVMENNRRGEKITHGCIIATITLYHPDGREAKPISYLGGENQPGLSLQTQDLYQLAQYLQEALHREKMLEQKLLTLQQLVHNTQEASESGWQALIDEDKLLSRLEMLENQLHVYSKNHSEDTLRQELVALQEDKDKYETTSKESLRRVLQEKLEAVTKLSDLEQSLDNMKDECGHLKTACEVSQDELNQLAQKYQDQLKEVADLQDKLQEAEHNHIIEMERIEEEKAVISTKLEEMTQQEISLSAKIESLQADNDFTKEQLAAMKAKLESLKEFNEDEPKLSDIDLNGSTTEEVDIIPLGPSKEDDKPENLEAKLKDLQQLIETYKDKLEKSDQKLKESNNKVEKVQMELDTAVTSSNEYLFKITSLEEKIKLSDYHMNQMVENALDNLKCQLEESAKQSNSSNDLIEVFKDHIHLAEKELTFQTPVNSMQNSAEVGQDRDNDDSSSDLDSTKVSSPPPSPSPSSTTAISSPSSPTLSQNNQTNLGSDNTTTNTTPPTTSPSPISSPPPDLLNDTVGMSLMATSPCSDIDNSSMKSSSGLCDSGIVTLSSSSTTASSHASSNLNGILMTSLDDDEGLKALLEEAKEAQQRAEQELSKCRAEKDVSECKLKKSSDDVSTLKDQLVEAEQEVKKKCDVILDLQDQIRKTEGFTQDVKREILELRGQLEGEKGKNKTTEQELEDAKMQLSTSQQSAKQNHNETESLRDKLRHLQDELESERNRRESPRLGHSDRLTPKSKEYQALKEECANLRKRIQAIEAEMKMSRKENLHLSSEYNKLQESYKHLESLKVKLESSEVSWKLNLTDAQKDAHIIRQETPNTSDGAQSSSSSSQGKLDNANTELVSLRQSCEEKVVEITCLQKQVTDLTNDYHGLQNMSRMVSLVSSVPLLMLLFAILMAVYPMLEAVTSGLS